MIDIWQVDLRAVLADGLVDLDTVVPLPPQPHRLLEPLLPRLMILVP